MPIHFVNTAAITAIAAALGSLTAHAHGHAPEGVRWLLTGGVAVYFAAVVLGGIFMRYPVRRLAVLVALTVLLPVLLGVFGAELLPPVLTWLVVLIVGLQVTYAFWDERNSQRRQNG